MARANRVDPRRIREEIDRFVQLIWMAGLARDSNLTVVRTVAGGQVLVTWGGSERLSVHFGERPSLREYIRWVQERQYNVLLSDYSFLQMSYLLEGKRILKHRLVYYPCPIVVTPDESVEFGIVDLLELLDVGELLERLCQESPLRFEFDPQGAASGHSASHVHVSRECCRIPVHAPLMLGRFIRFVFSHFYPSEWGTHQFLRDWPFDDVTPCILDQERRDLHLAYTEKRQPNLLDRLLGRR